eukprot:TRINITY_DN5886_c0_g1_i1.p1 TRINITY_DN5886_c0_g1~~TRINITY_DN5886_c0_g1_i1.p1  ORF type:complete len:859 (-),score=151.35 TRINITY_DN5886_c0_g1_i1:12-2588(-)
MPVDSGLHIPKEVGLLTVNSLSKLPIPWPRYQELRSKHVKPRQNDSLVVISVSWARQMHPDPTGARAKTILQLVTQAAVKLRAQGRVLIFLDFLSMPQHPFTAEQPAWTDEDNLVTIKVSETLPKLIFKADAVVHVSCALPYDLADEGTTYTISAQEFRRQCGLREVGKVVQVAELYESAQVADGQVRLFDQVISAGGHAVTGLQNLPGEVFKCHSFCQLGPLGDWLALGSSSSLEFMRAPYGFKIDTPPDEQGRLFLERAICIVKLALTQSQDVSDTLFCDSEAVKSQICKAASKIREATAVGGEALATELELLVEELESKTFTPQAYTPAQSVSQLVSHACVELSEREVTNGMMRAFLDELQILRSLKLFRAVRDNNMEECKRLLEESADASLPDSRGITCLHHAAQVASVKIVKVLVESRASCEARDYNTGGTAAHHVPLFAIDTTVEIVRLLSRDPTTLSQVNSAGVSAYERLWLWAEVALNGSPFTAMLDFLATMRQNRTMLQEKWSANAVLSTQCWGPVQYGQDEKMRVMPRYININGMRRVVYELQTDGAIGETILYLGFGRLLPWSLQLPALKTVAFETRCNIMCIGCEAVDAELLLEEDGGNRFHSDLFAVIDALPLPPLFGLLDASFGLGLNMLWRLQERLWGALLLNISWLFTSQFLNTSTHQRLKARAAQLAALASEKNIDKMVSMISDFALVPAATKILGKSEEDTTIFKAEYRAALQQASSSFWRMTELQPEWNFRYLTQMMSSRPSWVAEECVVIVACGSHAPATAVQESTFNLSMYLPISHQAYLSDSIWFWQCEGSRAVHSVIGLIKRMKQEECSSSGIMESSAEAGLWGTGTCSVEQMRD